MSIDSLKSTLKFNLTSTNDPTINLIKIPIKSYNLTEKKYTSIGDYKCETQLVESNNEIIAISIRVKNYTDNKDEVLSLLKLLYGEPTSKDNFSGVGNQWVWEGKTVTLTMHNMVDNANIYILVVNNHNMGLATKKSKEDEEKRMGKGAKDF